MSSRTDFGVAPESLHRHNKIEPKRLLFLHKIVWRMAIERVGEVASTYSRGRREAPRRGQSGSGAWTSTACEARVRRASAPGTRRGARHTHRRRGAKRRPRGTGRSNTARWPRLRGRRAEAGAGTASGRATRPVWAAACRRRGRGGDGSTGRRAPARRRGGAAEA